MKSMPRETSKQRAKRIPLDYYKRPDWLLGWKLGLTAAALVLALVWWASGLVWNSRGWPRLGDWARLRISHGRLSRVHATWESRCEACHVDFTPIDGSSWSPTLATDLRAGDKKC